MTMVRVSYSGCVKDPVACSIIAVSVWRSDWSAKEEEGRFFVPSAAPLWLLRSFPEGGCGRKPQQTSGWTRDTLFILGA